MSRRQRRARDRTLRWSASRSAAQRRAKRRARSAAASAVAVAAAVNFTLQATASTEAADSQRLKRIHAAEFLRQLTPLGHELFFVRSQDGTESLWKTDGTVAGTTSVTDSSSDPQSDPDDLTPAGELLFFTAVDPVGGRALFRSDGSGRGTVLVKDISPTSFTYPSDLTDVHGTLYFIADDGMHGVELWKSDGTRTGTVMVKDIDRGPAGSVPQELTAVGDKLFFTVKDGDRPRDLWKSDGTETGTVIVKDIAPDEGYYAYDPSELTAVRNRLFFVGDDDVHGPALWTSDGTSRGTVMVEDIHPDPEQGPRPDDLTAMNGTLYFTANDYVHGRELWKSDGTRRGTRMVRDVRPGPASFNESSTDEYFEYLTVVDDLLFFAADDGQHGLELWKSDGSRLGTTRLSNIDERDCFGPCPRRQFAVTQLVGTGTELYFIGSDNIHYTGLWKSDGTRRGTQLVSDLNLGIRDNFSAGLWRGFGNSIFLATWHLRDESYLWRLIGPGKACEGLAATITGSGTIYGTEGDDVIVGSGQRDLIYGLGGDDTICGQGGNDRLAGGPDSDNVDGNGGDDVLVLRDGSFGVNRGDGGPGTDTAKAEPDDVLLNVP